MSSIDKKNTINDKHRLVWMRGGVNNLTIITYVYGTNNMYHIFGTTNIQEEDPTYEHHWLDNDVDHGEYCRENHQECIKYWSDLP